MPKPKKRLTLSEQLKLAIKVSGMTQYRISKDCGLSQPTLNRFVNGERDLYLESAGKIAEYLGLEFIQKRIKKKEKTMSPEQSVFTREQLKESIENANQKDNLGNFCGGLGIQDYVYEFLKPYFREEATAIAFEELKQHGMTATDVTDVERSLPWSDDFYERFLNEIVHSKDSTFPNVDKHEFFEVFADDPDHPDFDEKEFEAAIDGALSQLNESREDWVHKAKEWGMDHGRDFAKLVIDGHDPKVKTQLQ